jgi:predicted GTPase
MASPRSAPTASDGGRRRVVILGAAGRDFHNFNMVYRDDPSVDVIAFTAAQIPGISGRRYPAALAGPRYPDGIPIVDEAQLESLCTTPGINEVVFAYSDVTHEQVMHLGSRALALGADFVLFGPSRTMLRSRLPVIAVSAVRTGCGKSSVARFLSRRLRERGKRVAVLRHPMPYGDLSAERVQRFASRADLDAGRCTIEEREEYEPHIEIGNVVYAGVDYGAILKAAENEADIILWDGGNNDFPFIRPDLHIALADALRPQQLSTHHPGDAVLRMADILVIAKADAAATHDVLSMADDLRRLNHDAPIVWSASPVRLDDPAAVKGRRVLVVEDGPTITHGGLPHGAGYISALAAGAAEIVDPRPAAQREIRDAYASYPHIGRVLPALGYGEAELKSLADTIAACRADIVVSATPIDLARLIPIAKPVVRARYDYAELEEPRLSTLLNRFVDGLSGPDRTNARGPSARR